MGAQTCEHYSDTQRQARNAWRCVVHGSVGHKIPVRFSQVCYYDILDQQRTAGSVRVRALPVCMVTYRSLM